MKTIAATIWCIAILFLGGSVAKETRKHALKHYNLLDTPPFTDIKSEYIDLLTLGARPVYDDIVAIWATQILMDRDLGSFATEDIFATLKKMAIHQPKSQGFYSSSCWYLGLVRKRADLCEPIILEGMTALPQNWQLPAMLGFMAAFKLEDYEKASVYFAITASIPGSPPYFAGVTQKIAQKGGMDTNMLNETFNILAEDPDSGIGEFVKRMLNKSQSGGTP